MGGKIKRSNPDYTNFPEHFRPLPENKEEDKVIIDAKRSADAKKEEKRANSMWELNRMGGGGKHKRAADYTNFSNDLFRPLPENKVEDDSIKEVKRYDYTNFPDVFRPLPENKEEEKVIIDAKRSADAKNEEKRANSMWELNRMGGSGKNKRAADYTNFPDPFRPLPENKVEDDNIKEVKRDYTNFPDVFRPLPENKEENEVIIDAKRSAEAKNEEKRADSMWDFNRMGAIGKNKRAADYTNFPDVFRPLPENKVEEDSIKEVKRDSG